MTSLLPKTTCARLVNQRCREHPLTRHEQTHSLSFPRALRCPNSAQFRQEPAPAAVMTPCWCVLPSSMPGRGQIVSPCPTVLLRCEWTCRCCSVFPTQATSGLFCAGNLHPILIESNSLVESDSPRATTKRPEWLSSRIHDARAGKNVSELRPSSTLPSFLPTTSPCFRPYTAQSQSPAHSTNPDSRPIAGPRPHGIWVSLLDRGCHLNLQCLSSTVGSEPVNPRLSEARWCRALYPLLSWERRIWLTLYLRH